MCDINTPRFDIVRNHIRAARHASTEWDDQRLILDQSQLDLHKKISFWPSELSLEVWNRIIESEKGSEQRREENIRLREAEANDAILGADGNLAMDVQIPMQQYSCWQGFKRHLMEQGDLEQCDIDLLESSVLGTLKKLSKDTLNTVPVKGLVIGHVQSGKTTNIAALMNMAADLGFNMFIVLTGRIENLRKQTHSRLSVDLRSGNLVWHGLGKQPNPLSEDNRLHTLGFGGDHRTRYFTVVLKNPTRLEKLRDWLRSYSPALNNMKILIIDDESDEAGINTGDVKVKDDRTKINGLILEIVKTQAKAVNYVGYTATPYANVLNESPSADTLYPASFIRSLRVLNQYFGPKEIFGIEGSADAHGEANAEGMDVIRNIPAPVNNGGDQGQTEVVDERAVVSNIQKGNLHDLNGAASLKNSIAWFLCAAATRRFWGHTKPASMLVHTSQKQDHHQFLADAIQGWLKPDRNTEVIRLCETVWIAETARFSLARLREQYPDYRFINDVRDYPQFADILPHIINLLSSISPIQIDENSNFPEYHKGIHLCIDNCANNGITDEGEHIRLLYPEPPPARQPDFCTAFIVVGGATLSRGLTLQGLVSTYFLRDSSLGDSLLQMGRWFGYRVGYELLPRIWMTQDTSEKFRWLAGVEQSLRDELKRYEAGASPSQFGPRVKAHPVLSWMRITAKNRMQCSEKVGWDFAGITNQTTMFRTDANWLDHNIRSAEVFLSSMLAPPKLIRGGAVYQHIPFDRVAQFLQNMDFHPRNIVFKEKENFIHWFSDVQGEAGYTAWNVVVAGFDNATQVFPPGEDPSDWWSLPNCGGFVKKVNRTRKGNVLNDGSFSIGALLSPSDRLGDCDIEIPPGTPSLLDVSRTRMESGLSLTPLLIIYRVSKDSKYRGLRRDIRHDLDTCLDLIGVAMIIPGKKEPGGLVREVTVKISPEDWLADVE